MKRELRIRGILNILPSLKVTWPRGTSSKKGALLSANPLHRFEQRSDAGPIRSAFQHIKHESEEADLGVVLVVLVDRTTYSTGVHQVLIL